MEKNKVHYEYYHLNGTEDVPELERFHFHTLRHPYVKLMTKFLMNSKMNFFTFPTVLNH